MGRKKDDYLQAASNKSSSTVTLSGVINDFKLIQLIMFTAFYGAFSKFTSTTKASSVSGMFTDVQTRRPRLVLGWVTTREDRVT